MTSYRGSRHYQIEALIVLAMAVRGESLLTALQPVKVAA
jgi:hypothetical protein